MGAPAVPVRITSSRAQKLRLVLFGIVWSAVTVYLNGSVVTHGFHPSAVLIPVGVFGTLLFLFTRAYRVAVIGDAGGLRIRNTFWTRHLDWTDVEAFELDLPERWMDHWKVKVVRRGGRELSLDATARLQLWKPSGPTVDGYLQALRAWLPAGGPTGGR